MAIDVLELAAFYESPLGLAARRLLRRQIRAAWPNVRGMDVLALGYATPFVRPFREEAGRTVALMPATQGVVRWPENAPALVCLAEESELPFADSQFERILLVHALEHSEQVRPFLREIWRVLVPEGRVLIAVPHRGSLWAASERTPFGHGHPYSRRQIARLLEDCLFEPGKPETALSFPPLPWRFLLRSPAAWDRIGHRLWPGLGGVVLIEATKRIYAMPDIKGRRRVRVPVLARH